ncbi:MAG: hypothetical protein ABIQ16_27110 [Polyangiaceae bacterium]
MIEILRGQTWRELPDATLESRDGNHYTVTVINMALTGRRRYDDKTLRIDGHETARVAVSVYESGAWKLDAWVA